jgi:hypothetical protein
MTRVFPNLETIPERSNGTYLVLQDAAAVALSIPAIGIAMTPWVPVQTLCPSAFFPFGATPSLTYRLIVLLPHQW